MITFHAIGSGSDAASYHDRAFSAEGNVRDADNYYMDESAGAKWQGKGARILGIEGQRVERQDFIDALDGKFLNPETGEIQNLASRGNEDRRAGFDMSIAPPKSVSIIALVGGDDRLIKAHETANAKAMAWLEEHAAIIRVKNGEGQNVKEQTGNLIWATIRHETNRNNEPQLHNHNVTMSASYDLDRNTWRSLTNDDLLILRNGADDIYKASMLQDSKRAGFEVEFSKNGRDFEIKGITQEQIAAFSGRSQQIEDAIRARGYEPEEASWAMRQAAALDTRSKKKELPAGVLQEAWVQHANSLGMDLGALIEKSKERAANANPAEMREEEKRLSVLAVSEAIEHLSEREQSFTVAQLEKEAVLMGKVPIEDVKVAIREHQENHVLIERDGMPSGATWYTTQKALDAEKQMAQTISEGKGQGLSVVATNEEFSKLLGAFEARKTAEIGKPFKLSDEQVNAAKNLLMHGDKFQAIQGDAGTGKTAALEFVREAAEKKGWAIQGVATTSSAAEELQASSGIKSNTIAGFFAERNTASKEISMEIEALKHQIRRGAPLQNREDIPRIEVRTLQAKSFDLNFGTNRYTFDHQRETVHKTGGDLLSRVAVAMVDAAEKIKTNSQDAGDAQTLGGKLKAFATEKVTDIAESLGNTLISYEKVGVVEATAARNALIKSNREERMDKLVGQLNQKEAQLSNLQNHGNFLGKPTMFVMDEASMTGVHDTQRFIGFVAKHGARGVLQGDIHQHGSVAAGKAFEQAQASGINLSVIEQTKRFDNATPQTQDAVKSIKGRGYADAIALLDRTEVDGQQLAPKVAERYLANLKELQDKGIAEPTVAVVAVTNKDRKAANSHIHDLLQANNLLAADTFTKEHFDDPQLTTAQKRNAGILSGAGVDRLVFNQDYKEKGVGRGDVIIVKGYDIEHNRILGTIEGKGIQISINPDKQMNFSPYVLDERKYSVGDKIESRAIIRGGQGRESFAIKNGKRGVVVGLDSGGAVVRWKDGQVTPLPNKSMRFADLGYAHTTIKDQGATYQRMIIAASDTGAKVFNRQATYVAATRAKDNTEIVTSNYEGLLKSAGKEVKKTSAHDAGTMSQSSSSLIKALEQKEGQVKEVGAKDQATAKQVDQKMSEHERGI
jgi:conjugative relaxase-like TrwC/TraI family protein